MNVRRCGSDSSGKRKPADLAESDADAPREKGKAARPDRLAARRFLLVIMAFILCLLWSSQIIPFYTRGELPNMIVQAKTPTVFVYVIDLSVVVPLALLSAWWLKQDRPWG